MEIKEKQTGNRCQEVLFHTRNNKYVKWLTRQGKARRLRQKKDEVIEEMIGLFPSSGEMFKSNLPHFLLGGS